MPSVRSVEKATAGTTWYRRTSVRVSSGMSPSDSSPSAPRSATKALFVGANTVNSEAGSLSAPTRSAATRASTRTDRSSTVDATSAIEASSISGSGAGAAPPTTMGSRTVSITCTTDMPAATSGMVTLAEEPTPSITTPSERSTVSSPPPSVGSTMPSVRSVERAAAGTTWYSSTSVTRSTGRSSRPSAPSAPRSATKASFVGANTVNSASGSLSAPTRSVATAASTSTDRSGTVNATPATLSAGMSCARAPAHTASAATSA